MGSSTSLLRSLAVSQNESSARRTSKGLTFSSTSRASLPLVPMAPKHNARSFLYISSNFVASAHCHTGQAYSRTGALKLYTTVIISWYLCLLTCLTCLNVLIDLLASCSTLVM